MDGEQKQNGATEHPAQAPVQQILIASDGVSVRVTGNVPPDVAEGMLYRALQHMGRQILRAQLQADAAPKVEIVPSAGGFRAGGMV